MSEISENLIKLKKELPSSVKLIVVSKTRTPQEILEACNTGHRLFGENRVQELLSKKDHLPPDIEWHLIGHLQSNKVKFIAPFISMIHSADSLKLLTSIDNEAKKAGRIIKCLLQIHIADEETKFGFSMDEIREMLASDVFANMKSVSICGVMGMGTFTADTDQVRKEFAFLKRCFQELKTDYFQGSSNFSEISMGMSGDYPVAIEEGSTMIRLGSIIFGKRNYPGPLSPQ